jgi:hypothetical protein
VRKGFSESAQWNVPPGRGVIGADGQQDDVVGAHRCSGGLGAEVIHGRATRRCVDHLLAQTRELAPDASKAAIPEQHDAHPAEARGTTIVQRGAAHGQGGRVSRSRIR